MSHNSFKHREVDGGHKTPCHEPMTRGGVTYRRDGEGYVVIPRRIGGRVIARRAHRARYEVAKGPVKNQLDHLCRNRWCCNPDHLEDVTVAVNVRRGDCTKLDEGEVALIRVLREEGRTCVELAREFGVSPSHVSRVSRGLYWSDGPCAHWEQRKGGTSNL